MSQKNQQSIKNRIVGSGMLSPKEIKANSKNWRKHPKTQRDALDGVLKEVGWVQEVIINKTTGCLVDGHLRVSLALERKEKEIPVKYVELTAAEEALVLATIDPVAAMAETDALALDALLRDVSTGEAAVQQMLADLAEKAGMYLDEADKEVIEDEVPEPPVDPVTKPGDLWLLGDHRLLCGDSTKAEDVEHLMANDRADLLLTDPPYNVDYEGSTGLKIENDSMPDKQFRQFLNNALRLAFDVCKPGASFYIWHADSEGYNFRGAVFDCQQKVRQCLIWAKSSLVMGRQDYQWQHEPCLYGWKDGASHSWYSDRKQTTLLHFEKPQRNGEHPTMKPVSLFAYLMSNSTAPQGIAYDPFLGSGTAIIAAEQLGRKCYGMELSPSYCDVIVKRWETLTGKKAVLEARHEG